MNRFFQNRFSFLLSLVLAGPCSGQMFSEKNHYTKWTEKISVAPDKNQFISKITIQGNNS
jgi:hypothetical protein